MQTILVVEDKKSMADMLARAFNSAGFFTINAFTVKEGLALLFAESIDAVVTDLRLPDGDGVSILKTAKGTLPFVPVIVMTAFGSIETAVSAVKEGAYDFITKPFDPEHLIILIKRALEEKRVVRENLVYKKEFPDFLKIPEISGISKPWQEVMDNAKKVAPLKTTVLMLGESGTGKEVVARAIHYLSPRANGPFVAVNCAAIPKDLIENELFGHEKGAFTGAAEAKPGRFELSHNGTIFLDEIGDMEMSLQSKLLRVLQDGEFERVGATKSIRADLRVIAASNKNLEEEVRAGRFREDLFYRLNVFPIIVPPLRERTEDIIPLAKHFIAFFSREMNKKQPVLSPDVVNILLSHEWKGNTRELKNAIERSMILCDGPEILPEHFTFNESLIQGKCDINSSLQTVTESAVRCAEKARIANVLKETSGNKSKAAILLKVSYKTLLNKIKEYGI